MSPATERLLEDALTLPDEERVEVAFRLIRSLDPVEETNVDLAWATEIERRCDAIDSGVTQLLDWDEVSQRIERELLGK
jgi:putative addiction module component (TIGR02574 family)